MRKKPLNVFVSPTRVGRLTRSDREEDRILFGYNEHCTADNAVSLTMPVRVDQYDAMGGLLPIFEMNLPEGILKERLRNEFAKAVPEFDDLDLLAIVGSSQIGRLRYSSEQQLVEAVPPQDLEEILTYQGTSDLFAHLLKRFARYSGISGVQPKLLVRDQTPQKLAHLGATHIIKAFDSREYPELAANEFICTQGAVAAGLETVRLRLSANRRLLVAERFDLRSDGTYCGTEDFCVLEGRRAHGRYDSSYEAIARRISDFVSSGALAQAREQFALSVAYSCAIENGDAHLKNFSVLYDSAEGEVRFAPIYDMVSTTVYISRDTLALTLGGTKQFPGRAELIRFIRLVTSKSERAAVEMIERVATGVGVAMREGREYGKKHPGASRFADRLVASMSRGLNRLACAPKRARRRGLA